MSASIFPLLGILGDMIGYVAEIVTHGFTLYGLHN